MATSASSSELRNVSSTFSTPRPSLNGFVRDVPTIVPPRGSRPEISRGPSGSDSPAPSPLPPAPRPHAEPLPAVAHGDDLAAARHHATPGRADHRVEPGAVPAAGEQADTHAAM